MSKVLVLVEGQTEEMFVKRILYNYFSERGIYLVPKLITTKVVKGGSDHKGGGSSYKIIKKNLRALFKDTSADTVTTMFDFYGLPANFPAWDTEGDCYDQVIDAERVFGEDVNEPRFVPYLQLHEFEALLFSDPNVIASTLNVRLQAIQDIRDAYSTPEEINNSPETSPSKRLLKLSPSYGKEHFGSIIAARIGLDTFINECPHFGEWVAKIENLHGRW